MEKQPFCFGTMPAETETSSPPQSIFLVSSDEDLEYSDTSNNTEKASSVPLQVCVTNSWRTLIRL